MKKFLERQPFVLLGAFGILALIDGLLQLPKYLAQWVSAWQSITRPIWEIIIGWGFHIFNMELPVLISDYLTMGVITAAASMRVDHANNLKIYPRSILIDFLLWPKLFCYVFRKRNDKEMSLIHI